MTPGFELVGCNDNLFEQNDASWSPNIAFEATFSRGNVFRDNYANCCNYGFWLGFSRDGELDGNLITENRRAGIAVENGVNFQIKGNTLQSNSCGILLWSKRIQNFELALPENNTSHDWNIERNQFIDNKKAIRIVADQDHGIRSLPISGELGYPAPVPHSHTIRRNYLKSNVQDFEFVGIKGTIIEQNGEAE